MSQQIYVINASLAVLLLLLALCAGFVSGCLAFRKTEESLQRTSIVTLALLGAMTLISIGKVTMLIATYSYRSWFVLDSALLFLSLIMAPTAAIAVFSLPRLLQLAKLRPRETESAVSRTKRRAASEVRLVVPIQVLVIEALLYAAINVFPLGMELRMQILVIGLLVLMSPALLIWRQSIRHRRIHRDDGTSMIHFINRVVFITMAFMLLAFGIIHTMKNAKTLRTDAERNEMLQISFSPAFSGK
ncbi:phosphoethanolamine transferase domain-containing protein [Paenibacillus glycinis]|uniref:Uncharacterized protein n=1 Tax=Paenibacillus glycinis TaxID=2697035 RepID=A0ABW9XWH7_9BACL|nr:phosphoethanolamine transferase domain-containing protein [Paenibacillus glycinis]NBD26607.1 hypothetical protein [Paenibacillus glycinis]